jgi:hypothetical protein
VVKRVVWLGIGTGLGFGMSRRINRAMRRTVERYSPERLATDASSAARRMGAQVADALAEGRTAMHERERQLRNSMGPRQQPR